MTDLDSLIRNPWLAQELTETERRAWFCKCAALILALGTIPNGQSQTSDRALSVKEASFKMGMSSTTLQRKLNRGEFANIARKKGKRSWVLSEKGVEAWIGGKR